MNNFWEKLPTPFFALAPMADVTDPAFRMIVTKYSRYGGVDIYDKYGKFTRHHAQRVGGPDVLWTEFVSADGLASAGREVLKRDLEYTEAERPIVAQLFSSNPEKMRIASKLCAELGFDGIDINMGCPDRSIEKQGAGACMIKTPEIASTIIQAAKDGVKDAGKNILVSVKTRVGYNKVEIDTWIPHLLAQDIAALTVHARTRKEMSAVPARWEHIKQIVEIRDKMNLKTKILGNGDVKDMDDAYDKWRATGCDGIMIGRAIFGNPWLFSKNISRAKYIPVKSTHKSLLAFCSARASRAVQGFFQKYILHSKKRSDKDKYWLHTDKGVSTSEKLRVLVEHTKLFEELLGDIKSFAIMKKHFKAYVNGFDGAKELRMQLMETKNAKEVETIINEFFK